MQLVHMMTYMGCFHSSWSSSFNFHAAMPPNLSLCGPNRHFLRCLTIGLLPAIVWPFDASQ